MPQVRYTPADVERFNSYVLHAGPEECWFWVGNRNGNDYGLFPIKSVVGNGFVMHTTTAHRFAYIVHHEITEIVDTQVVRHKCQGNRQCVNPRHLELGTQYDNIEDVVKAKNKTATSDPKFVARKIAYIKAAKPYILTNHGAMTQVADMLGMSKEAVHDFIYDPFWDPTYNDRIEPHELKEFVRALEQRLIDRRVKISEMNSKKADDQWRLGKFDNRPVRRGVVTNAKVDVDTVALVRGAEPFIRKNRCGAACGELLGLSKAAISNILSKRYWPNVEATKDQAAIDDLIARLTPDRTRKLDAAVVAQIRACADWIKEHSLVPRVCQMFNLSRATLYAIVNGQSWKQVLPCEDPTQIAEFTRRVENWVSDAHS
jgi:predicted transcriptional regulator